MREKPKAFSAAQNDPIMSITLIQHIACRTFLTAALYIKNRNNTQESENTVKDISSKRIEIQTIISSFNTRLQEIASDEMRGRRISYKLRRSLQDKRNDAHLAMRMLLGLKHV